MPRPLRVFALCAPGETFRLDRLSSSSTGVGEPRVFQSYTFMETAAREPVGTADGWNHTFNWDSAQSALTLGLNYTGFIDDLAVFNRELTATEARTVFALPRGIANLHSENP